MFLHQRVVPGLASFSYVVGDEDTGVAAVVDPVRDIEPYLDVAAAHGLVIRHILETHVHADFVSGAAELLAGLGPEAHVYSSGLGGAEWTPPYADRVVRDGDAIDLGAVRLQALHTPGHTPEHVTWLLYDGARSRDIPYAAFTGDFLLVGSVGRPDLLGSAARDVLARELYRSVFERLPALPDFVEIFPAHGAGSLCGKAIGSRRSSTLGYERLFNEAFRRADEETWTERLLADMPAAPPRFRHLKEVNVRGPAIVGPRPETIEVPPEAVRDLQGAGAIVLDLRPKEAFAAGHIPGSVSIPFGESLAAWASWVLSPEPPLVLVTGDPDEVPEAARALRRVGHDAIEGTLDGGIAAWQAKGYEVSRFQTTSVHGLAREIEFRTNEGPVLLDVRTDGEWKAGRIRDAIHIPLPRLQEGLGEVPSGRGIRVVCGSGHRASIACSILARQGFTDLTNVLGGMTAWSAAGLPVER